MCLFDYFHDYRVYAAISQETVKKHLQMLINHASKETQEVALIIGRAVVSAVRNSNDDA